MNPLQPNTALLPPALRAIALSLLIETVVPMLRRTPEAGPGFPASCEGGASGKDHLSDLLRCKCDELSALVLRSTNPPEAAGDVLAYLPKRFEFVFEQAPLPARFESGRQGNGQGAGESWDSPFEPRRFIRFPQEANRAEMAE
jgi:hypothetical protein